MLQDAVVLPRPHTSGSIIAAEGLLPNMPKGDATTARIHREWLQQVSKVTGKSLTRLANETGLAVSTLTRPVKEGEAGTSTLHANTIKKLSAHTGVAPPAIEETMPQALRRPFRGFWEDAEPFSPHADDDRSAAVAALVARRPHIEAWVVKTRVLELEGFLPGDVVLVDTSRAPKVGDRVCATVSLEPQRREGDVVMRVYERAGAADILIAASMDPVWRQPIAIDDRVSIRGVIDGMIRAPRTVNGS